MKQSDVTLTLSTSLALSDDELARQFKSLSTSEDVARLLDVPFDRLTYHLWRRVPARRYKKFRIRKRGGGTRELSSPQGGLRIIQQKLSQVLYASYRVKASAHGFARGKSILTNAERHVARRLVLNVDLKDFFPSIHFGRVRGMFMGGPFSFPNDVATILAQVCFAGESGLPQGSPTSPMIANMIAAPLDSRLQEIAEKLHCTYTRYADDITFSTTRTKFPPDLVEDQQGKLVIGALLDDALCSSGFAANLAKLKLRTRFERQEVTGLVVNDFANVPRNFVRQIRAMIHAWKKYGFTAAQHEYTTRYETKHRHPHSPPRDFAAVLFGKLAYLRMVRGKWDGVFLNLLTAARGLNDKRFLTLPSGWDAVVVLERENSTGAAGGPSQGSAFVLDGVGLVTAAHVVYGMSVLGHQIKLTSMQVFRPYANAPRKDVEIQSDDRSLDVAILNNPFGSIKGLSAGETRHLKPGDEVRLIGYGHWADGSSYQEIRARVTGWKRVEKSLRFVIDRPIPQGASGGPVLNAKHQVIGIAVTGSKDGEYPNTVVPIELLKAHLAGGKADPISSH